MKQGSKIFKVIIVVFLFLLVMTFSNQAFAQGDTWITVAPMLAPRYFPTAGVINGQLYVVSGSVPTGGATDTMEAYDPFYNTCTYKKPIPTNRAKAGAMG